MSHSSSPWASSSLPFCQTVLALRRRDGHGSRTALFCDIARLLERYVGLPCGIAADSGEDEHRIDPALFIAFFERLWGEGWILESHGFVSGWAAHAAGMIENITLCSRRWVDRNGNELSVKRYLRPDEIPITTPREPRSPYVSPWPTRPE